MKRLNAKQLRTTQPNPEVIKIIKKNPIYIILDNVLDTYNVGAIFRLADAVAAEKIFLCQQTETPPNPKIKKASINTWQWVEWEYVETAVDAIAKLKISFDYAQDEQNSRLRQDFGGQAKLKIIAVEQNKKSIPLSKLKVEFPVAIVVGNESFGVSKEVLDIADIIVELPMYGINKSLNVMVCTGIVIYKIIEKL